MGDLITRLATPVKVIECPIDRGDGEDLLNILAAEIEALIGRAPRGETGKVAEYVPNAGGGVVHGGDDSAQAVGPDKDPGNTGWASAGKARDVGHGSRGGLVVGLPINMDGSEGQRAKLVRAWAARIAARTGWGVELFDERLTSSAADAKMARTGLTYKQKKERRDAIAAAEILRGYLEGQ